MIQVDICHPLASLEWRTCKKLSSDSKDFSCDFQVVSLKGKVYVYHNIDVKDAKLKIYTPATDMWEEMDCPIPGMHCILTTYCSQLVMVGSKTYGDDDFESKKVWTLNEQGQWQETLTPMPESYDYNVAISHGDHLVVADTSSNVVYVYKDHHWARAQHLPKQLSRARSAVSDQGVLFLTGAGTDTKKGYQEVYSASLDSLIASCQPSDEKSQLSSVWQRLSDMPHQYSVPTVFGSRLIAVANSGIRVYSPSTKSWIHIGDVPFSCFHYGVAVLSSNELMVLGNNRQVFKVMLIKCKFYTINHTYPFILA